MRGASTTACFWRGVFLPIGAGCLADNVFKGHAAQAIFGNVSLHPSGVVLFGPAARAVF